MNSPATVQRYELASHGQYSMRYESLDEDPNGDWVKWEDHCRALEAAAEALKKYGRHAEWCAMDSGKPCDCGFAEEVRGLARYLLYDAQNKETYQSGPYQLTRKKGENP